MNLCVAYLVDFLVVPVRVDVSQFGGDAVVLSHHEGVMGDQHHLLIGPTVAYVIARHKLPIRALRAFHISFASRSVNFPFFNPIVFLK